MARENPVGGGVVYYGHSTDSDADFRAAMSLLSGSGHITTAYSSTGFVIKYDWMDTGKWISNLTTEGYTGFAYSVYKSVTGDVFARLGRSDSPYSAPNYVCDGGTCWDGNAAGGIATKANGLSVFKLKSTDVIGTDETYEYIVEGSGYPYIFPDNISSSTSGSYTYANINGVYTNYKYTVLGPIIGKWCSGVPTYARQGYYSDVRINPGAYNIAGYNFRAISVAYDSGRSYAPVLLRNDATTS